MEAVKNAILAIVSTLLMLVAFEGLLRVFMDPSQLYSNVHGVPVLGEWYHEAKFWGRYRDGREFASNHDAQLGWDYDIAHDRVRGKRDIPLAKAADTTRIVAIGDSFTYGIDVEVDENYPALLDALDGVEVLNMGIPGYGIDQAYLKYRAHGQKFQPDVVVFGIYVSDYERASLGFTYYAKPKFVIVDGTPVLRGQPIAPPQTEFARLDQIMSNKIYVWEVVRNFWRKSTVDEAALLDFYEHTDEVVRHMLTDLKTGLNASQHLVVLHIRRAESYIDTHPFRDEVSRRLLTIYREVGVNYIDLSEEFVSGRSAQAAYQEDFYHFPDGSVGHYSATGHKRVADLIVQALAREGIIQTNLQQGN